MKSFHNTQSTQSLSQGEQLDEHVPENVQCNVCMGKPSKPMLTKCGHVFCKSCISTWLKRKETCPTCNMECFEGSLAVAHFV